MKNIFTRTLSAVLAATLVAATPVAAFQAFASDAPETVEIATSELGNDYWLFKDKKISSVDVGAETTVVVTDDNAQKTDITIGKGVESLDGLFRIDDSFMPVDKITVDADNGCFEVVDGVLYDEAVETLIIYPAASENKAYTMPSTLKTYEKAASKNGYTLDGAENLETIAFSKDFFESDYEEIVEDVLKYYSEYDESYIEQLIVDYIANRIVYLLPVNVKSVSVAEGNEVISSPDGMLYDGEGKAIIRFFPASGKTEYVLPEMSATIAFAGANLDKLTLSKVYTDTMYNLFLKENWSMILMVKEDPTFIAFAQENYGVSAEKFSDISDELLLEIFENWYKKMLVDNGIPATGAGFFETAFISYINSFLNGFVQAEFVVSENDEHLSVVDGVLYNKNKTTPVKYPVARESHFFVMPETVEGYVPNDGFYEIFSTDTYPVFQDNLTAHVSAEQAEYLVDYEFAYTVGISRFCVDKLTDKLVEYNAQAKEKREECQAKIDAEISKQKESLENGYITQEEYERRVRIAESRMTLYPEIVECGSDHSEYEPYIEEVRITSGDLRVSYKAEGEITVEADEKANLVFESSDESVVKVDENGNYIAVGGGIATITVTDLNTGVSATCNITVTFSWWQWIVRILLFGFLWY